MPTERDQQPPNRDRAKKWLANARVTASVAANIANPLAGPVAERASGDAPRPIVEVTQRVQEDARKDWARYERLRRERHAGDLPAAPIESKRQRERGR